MMDFQSGVSNIRSEELCSASSTTSMSYALMEGVSKPGTVPLSMVHIG
jgi:hypothetical protein